MTLPNEDDENLPLGLMAALSPGCVTLVLEQLERLRGGRRRHRPCNA